MMHPEDVVQVVHVLENAGIDVWLDGGWGVDALLGQQTRPHDDLDVVISLVDAEPAKSALAPLGFVVAEDELPTRFVARDPQDRQVDFHTVSFDSGGGGVQQLQDGRAFRYPPEGFAGTGTVDGCRIRCLTPEVQVLVHLGYEPDETDHHDMRLLQERFGVPLPPLYQNRNARE